MVRVAVLDQERCRLKDCGFICRRFCPPVRNRIEAITLDEVKKKPIIVERLCVGCGICVRKCPFKAISIVNLANELEKDCSHRFDANSFKLYRLPTPLPGKVTGLIGKNGIGKTTVLKILAGELKPNLGRYEDPPDWPEIVQNYRGSVLQDYFAKLSEGRVRVAHKPQYVDRVPTVVKGTVKEVLERVDQRGGLQSLLDALELRAISDRALDVLSGGELQRVTVAAATLRDADLYLFDEPSSYLDVRQRLMVARVIRSLAKRGRMVVVTEHDLAVLDYLSDHVSVFYGVPGVYGVVSHPHSVREGINIFLDGYLVDENVRFRDEPITFHLKPPISVWTSERPLYSWGLMEKAYEGFKLTVEPGEAHAGEVVGVLGPNGIGKTTFIKLLAGIEKPDRGECPQTALKVSYKPQYISADYEGTVESLLKSVAEARFGTDHFRSEVLSPLSMEKLMERDLRSLSGGELQRVAIAVCLARDADLYLLDEPSAYMDVEERYAMTRVIRRIVEERGKTAFIVEHDIVVEDFVADRLIVFEGKPGVEGLALRPEPLRNGMNRFLGELNVTFRRDPSTGRPRVNKEESRLDKTQKSQGEYYYVAAQT
ncbi:MAG: ribosome biogenesis/translation initiation ATPase RLI [Candidatus Bathyarchaeia archaeon]